jgi:hypothetical protein
MQSAPRAHTLSMWLPKPVMEAAKPATKPAATKPAAKPAATKPAATKPAATKQPISSIWMKDEPSVVVVPSFLSKEEREWQDYLDRQDNFFGRDYS